MAISVSKWDVWVAEIADEPGALAAKLEGLAAAKIDLDFMLGRRQADKPGQGVVFVTGVKGVKAAKAAAAAGFAKSPTIGVVRVDGPNKPGAVHQLVRAVAAAGISMRGASAETIGKKFAAILAFDSSADAAAAVAALRKTKGR
jgi:hypothetical protein